MVPHRFEKPVVVQIEKAVSQIEESSDDNDEDDDSASDTDAVESGDDVKKDGAVDTMEVDTDVENNSSDSDDDDEEDSDSDTDLASDVEPKPSVAPAAVTTKSKTTPKAASTTTTSTSVGASKHGKGSKSNAPPPPQQQPPPSTAKKTKTKPAPPPPSPPPKRSSSAKPPKMTLNQLEDNPPERWNVAYVRTLITGQTDDTFRNIYGDYIRGDYEAPDVLGLNERENERFINFFNVALKYYQNAPAVKAFRQFDKLPAPSDFFDSAKYPHGLFDSGLPNNLGRVMKDFTAVALVYAPHLIFPSDDGKPSNIAPTGKFIKSKTGEWIERGLLKRKFDTMESAPVAAAPVVAVAATVNKGKDTKNYTVEPPRKKKAKIADNSATAMVNKGKDVTATTTTASTAHHGQVVEETLPKKVKSHHKEAVKSHDEPRDKKEKKSKKEKKDKKDRKDKKTQS